MAYEFNPSLIILRDTEGDYLASFDGGKTSVYLTIRGEHKLASFYEEGEVLEQEHAVWQSGPGS